MYVDVVVAAGVSGEDSEAGVRPVEEVLQLQVTLDRDVCRLCGGFGLAFLLFM